jgi:ketosteroid isomerase-like protein
VISQIDATAAQQLVSRWWCAYDEGEFAVLDELLDDDATFRCRTDTGTTTFEDFVRAEARGRERIVRWQTRHRLDSPYPLRHHATNFHFTGSDKNRVRFRHYLAVTQVKDVAPVAVPAGVVTGELRALADGSLRISELEIVLDTMDSVPLRELRDEQETLA